MSNSEDIAEPSGPIQPEDYTVLYIREPDELVLVNAHPPVVEVVRSSLGSLIQEESSMTRMAITFTLEHNFFTPSLFSSSEESYRIKKILGVIIQELQNLGWLLLISSDLGQCYTHSALFFRCVVTQQLNTGPVTCIAPSSQDR